MNMIDRFVEFSNMARDYRKEPSIAKRIKCSLLKRSILKEILVVKEITVKDVFEYMWVYGYALNKFPNEPKDSFVPDNVSIISASGFYIIHYNDGDVNLTVKAKEGNPIRDAEYFDININIDSVGLSIRTNKLSEKSDKYEQVFQILKECFFYIMEYTMDKLLKGD